MNISGYQRLRGHLQKEQRVTWPISDVGYRQLIPPVSVIPRAGLGKICAQDKDDFNHSLHLLHVPYGWVPHCLRDPWYFI